MTGWLETVGSVVQGRDQLVERLSALLDSWAVYRLEPERVEQVGDRVLTVVREVARGRSSGLSLDSRWGYVLTVRAGAIARVEAYRDPEDAIAAVERRS